ncbi:MAG: rod shape-determining protein [Clostridia bacterium]|nr:rod shape-determining protein [Clostridia bacterium]
MLSYVQDIGIDLGTSSVLISTKSRGVVLREPSVVTLYRSGKTVHAVGQASATMLGRTPVGIVAVRPMKDGVIADYSATEHMLRALIKKVCSHNVIKPRAVISVPGGATEVEKRAVKDAALVSGVRKAYIVSAPIAAAVGLGIDISRPEGCMVIDIGGGVTDIAVISMNGIVVSGSLKTAGERFDDAIVRYVRKKFAIIIGERTAEYIKKEIGCVYPRPEDITAELKGRSLLSGLPQTIVMSSSEVMEALSDTVNLIIEEISNVLEQTPPELSGDIAEKGIYLVGGGSMLYGFDKLISSSLGIKVNVPDDPIAAVGRGTGKLFSKPELLS